MFKRGCQPKQKTVPPMPKVKKFGSTFINVKTALDGCGANCPNFEVKIECQLSGEDLSRPFFYSYRCEHANDCYRLVEILKKTNADDEEE